jgi:hypothetical protein
MTMQRLPLVGLVAETGQRLAGEQVDLLAIFCWLNRPVILKAVEGLVDSEYAGDEAQALSASDRAMKLAEIEQSRH